MSGARWRAALPWLTVTAGAGLCVAAVVVWHTVADPHGDVDALPWLLVFASAAGNVALGDAFIRRHRRHRDEVARLVRAATADRDLLAARDAIITARDAEIDGLNAQVMHLSSECEALAALVGDRQPRRPTTPAIPVSAPDPVWADIVRRLGEAS